MKTDSIFYKIFQAFPELIFELIGTANVPASPYQFKSVEVKELARCFDGVFLPPKSVIDCPVVFAEVQFQPKPDFYWRLFSEIFVYLGQYQPQNDWLTVAIFARRSLDPGLPQHYRWFQLHDATGNQALHRIYLDELATPTAPSLGFATAKLVIEPNATAPQQAQQLVQQAHQTLTDPALKDRNCRVD